MTPQPRRKKWTEAEERTLIDKYGEMSCDGTLSKMKTREKKYMPVALHVNSVHHVQDPVSYPWQWTWKDVSNKVQNMRHQYDLVKQKIKKQESSSGEEEFDWMEGTTHWSNFLRYKEVFGDVPHVFVSNQGTGGSAACNGGFEGAGHEMDIMQFEQLAEGDFVGGIDNLEFDYDGEEGGENYNGGNKSEISLREDRDADAEARYICDDAEPSASGNKKKRKLLKGLEKKAWGFLVNQMAYLKEMEAQFEQREAEGEQERQRRELLQMEMEKEREKKWEEMEKNSQVTREKLRRQWNNEWGAMEREKVERENRREEELAHERECEERLIRRRSEWKKRMEEMLRHHRAEIGQIQARLLDEQQNLTTQFVGIVSQWTGHPSGLSDHTGASTHYLSQMMQNLHHVNGMVHADSRVGVDGDNQEDQFIVDG